MKSNPGAFSTIIASTTETAFQRAIFLGGPSLIEGKTVRWLDIELPVDKHRKARGHCVDLIGTTDEEFVICELKFGKNSATDSPEYAAAEIKRYLQDIRDNHSELDSEDNIHHTNGEHFFWGDVAKKCQPIIAANEEYWTYWTKNRKVSLPVDIPCYSLNVSADYFKQQKSDRERYTPSTQDLVWTRL